ncbi:MAG: HK97 family phage prohead protease, partial [Atopobiaceae bacterium]|nr:HK97 family phage prohead protease [Atopobiaceae bacterium]
MPQRNIKSVTAKADIDGAGHITGYAATFTREPDWVGDVIAKGAFAECLERIKASGTVLPMLYNHDQALESFIGRVTSIEEDDHGLLFSADFDETVSAQRARQLAMDGRLAKFSFAYVILDQCEVELEDGRKANELR